MLKILGKSSSINVRKVLWTCAEIGLPYELEQWGSGAQTTNTAYFLALNPNGMVPVIVDDGQSLWESNSICRYLASKHQRTDLLPQEAMKRAQVEKWMDWQATELNNAWRYAFMALVRQSAAHRDSIALENSAAEWNRHMHLLDAQLDSTDAYANGATFTLADIVLGLSVHRWMSTPIERPAIACSGGVLRAIESARWLHATWAKWPAMIAAQQIVRIKELSYGVLELVKFSICILGSNLHSGTWRFVGDLNFD